MKKNKRARQEGALQRLQTARVVDSKGWQQMQRQDSVVDISGKLKSTHNPVPGDAWIQHDCNWQQRRDAEIVILKKKLNIS